MLDDLKIARENFARYVRARDARHAEYVRSAKKYDQFYLGEQWDKETLDKLAAEKRPALTINMVLATVNAALGEQIKTAADIRFKPARQGDEDTANAINQTFQYISEQNNLDDLEPLVVADGFIQERGYYDVRMAFDKNLNGDVVVNVENPLDVIPDPDAWDADPSTWSECFITRWLSIEDLEEEFGKKKADKLRELATGINLGRDSLECETPTFGDPTGMETAPSDNAEMDLQRVRVIERQYYKMRNIAQIVDIESGDVRDLPEKYQKDKELQHELMRSYSNIVIRNIRKKIVRITVTADSTVLHDDWSIYRSFTLVPYFPYFRRGNPMGLVRNLISPQELLNKTSSQELHIVNTTANSGWVVQENSLANMDADELAERGAETGLVVEYKNGYEPPAKIQPNQIPTGIDRISQKALISIRQISGINESLVGADRADVSGVAIQQRRESGQTQLAVPFKNIARTRKFLARKILELIQDFYDDTRTIYITNTSEPEQPREQMTINQPDENGDIKYDVTKGDYDVVIGQQPSRDTFDETQFAESLQLREAGVQIPDHIIVEHSNLSRRTELARLLKEMAGMGEKTEEQMQIEQMQQELMMEEAQLSVEEIRAKVASLQATAGLNEAKTESLIGQNDSEIEYDKMDLQRELQSNELDSHLKLAILSHQANLDKSRMDNQTKIHTDQLKAKQAANKPKPTSTGKK